MTSSQMINWCLEQMNINLKCVLSESVMHDWLIVQLFILSCYHVWLVRTVTEWHMKYFLHQCACRLPGICVSVPHTSWPRVTLHVRDRLNQDQTLFLFCQTHYCEIHSSGRSQEIKFPFALA